MNIYPSVLDSQQRRISDNFDESFQNERFQQYQIRSNIKLGGKLHSFTCKVPCILLIDPLAELESEFNIKVL